MLRETASAGMPWFMLVVAAGVLGIAVHPAVHSQEADDDAAIPGWREEFARDYEPPRDYGHDWRLGSMFGYTPEDGLLIGPGAILYEFGFRSFPYVYRMSLTGGISIPTANYKVVYTLFMPVLTKSTTLDLYAHASALEIRNFYGYGNASKRVPEQEDEGYYRLPSREFWVQPTLYYALGEKTRMGLGLWIKQFRVLSSERKILTQADLDSLGDNRATAGFGAQFVWDGRDQEDYPTSGMHLRVSAWNYAGLFSRQRPFQRVAGDVRLWSGVGAPSAVVLALRIAGERLWGSVPFYESAFLGGGGSLRGYSAQRFSGDASLFGSAELRIRLCRWRILLPTEVGLILFGDAGRVWFEGDSPGPWHADAGVGCWAAPVSRALLISFSMASSSEGLFFHATTGFSF